MNLGHYLRLIRRRAKPEEGDDLDGCALDFTVEDFGPLVHIVAPEREGEEDDDRGA